MTLPNFLVIGAAKSGTTSLHFYLAQHPQVFMCPVKEPGFFAFEGEDSQRKDPWRAGGIHPVITDLHTYQSLFGEVTDQAAIGEVSPAYLVRPKACERIQHYIPHARLIAVLRNPIERAYSAFLMQRLYSDRPVADFAQLIKTKALARHAGVTGETRIDAGFYYQHLRRYYDRFSPGQMRIYLYEDLKEKALSTLQDMFAFLQINETFQPDTSIRHMSGGVPRNNLWRAVLFWLNRSKVVLRPFLPARVRHTLRDTLYGVTQKALETQPPPTLETRQAILDIYREDILKLQDLISRDLSAWME